ncbi:MAG: DNA adenine methylase [Magnetococcales bacterium]|nr:DNA adenine methylase [Magnetococcales bacterium]MBF0115138.1 DNA adenine methylase [Magnetococcales bacterium]
MPYTGMPSTRYQGSKRKFLPFIHKALARYDFKSCLDLFGGTGSVTHLMKRMGKNWIYNDIIKANTVIARALFTNEKVSLGKNELLSLFHARDGFFYDNVISEIYPEIYYTDTENNEVDIVTQNIHNLEDDVKKAEAFYCLFQAALIKRPYNLFHRANLHMRTKEVKRSFGNKVTWDKPFIHHMEKFYDELVEYRLNSFGSQGVILNKDAFHIDCHCDLVYIDTPYSKSRNKTETNYFNFYHFLDALLLYNNIRVLHNSNYSHKPIYNPNRNWFDCKDEMDALGRLFRKFYRSIVCLSYRSDGYPSVEMIKNSLSETHKNVIVLETNGKYALSKKFEENSEVLVCGEPE